MSSNKLENNITTKVNNITTKVNNITNKASNITNKVNNKMSNSIYYNLIILATIIAIFSLVPIIYEIIQQKITSNLPYISLVLIAITFLIYMYISITKGYYLHLFFYTFGLLCIFIIIFFKRMYDSKNIIIHKSVENIYKYNVNTTKNTSTTKDTK